LGKSSEAEGRWTEDCSDPRAGGTNGSRILAEERRAGAKLCTKTRWRGGKGGTTGVERLTLYQKEKKGRKREVTSKDKLGKRGVGGGGGGAEKGGYGGVSKQKT